MATVENNIVKTAGYSAQKEHWQKVSRHGTRTSCKKKISYSVNDTNQFFDVLRKYPELCCKICSNNFREYVRISIEAKAKKTINNTGCSIRKTAIK
jgi:hypothetical protein